jgi:hypothetical protein
MEDCKYSRLEEIINIKEGLHPRFWRFRQEISHDGLTIAQKNHGVINSYTGSAMATLVPLPGSLSMVMLPSCSLTKSLA